MNQYSMFGSGSLPPTSRYVAYDLSSPGSLPRDTASQHTPYAPPPPVQTIPPPPPPMGYVHEGVSYPTGPYPSPQNTGNSGDAHSVVSPLSVNSPPPPALPLPTAMTGGRSPGLRRGDPPSAGSFVGGTAGSKVPLTSPPPAPLPGMPAAGTPSYSPMGDSKSNFAAVTPSPVRMLDSSLETVNISADFDNDEHVVVSADSSSSAVL